LELLTTSLNLRALRPVAAATGKLILAQRKG
jgi:hypothetical protein